MRFEYVRPLKSNELDRLNIFLYNSIEMDDEIFDVDIIYDEKYYKYIKDFPREKDLALVFDDIRISGIIWSRLFTKEDNSFGYVDDNTPEILLSVLSGYNVLVIGKQLLDIMLNELKILNYKQASTSVYKNDKILETYLEAGFVEYKVDKENNRITLVKNLLD